MSNEKFNVLVILLDGLRSDRITLCPSLLSILKKGYFFSNMITAAPYTLASLHAIFSGLYPTKNGVDSYFNMFKFRKDVCKTLTQYLHDMGYYTQASLGNESIVPTQGFDEIMEYDENKEDLIRLHKSILSKSTDRNFFLFLQYNNIHTECIKNIAKKYTDFDKKYFSNYELNKENYNSYLLKMDIYLKELFDYLADSGLLKNTLIVLFSDHGTSNGEKIGEKIYGSFTYDYTIKTFCCFLIPGIEGKEIKFQTSTVDIMPTIMDFLGIEADETYEHLQGKSLTQFIEGREIEDRIVFSETGGLNGPWPSHHKHNVFCVRMKKRKLIFNKTPNTWELYDLEKDPEERNNIFDNNDPTTSRLQKTLLDHIKSNQKTPFQLWGKQF